MGSRRHAPRALVVGAGLTGAALAWVASRSGYAVDVVSAERPASQATALAPGIVHGLGPPGGVPYWAGLSDEQLAAEADRAQRGYEILREVLLAARAPCGYRRVAHRMLLPPGFGERAREVAERLCRAGFAVEIELRAPVAALCGRREALVSPRRLVYELLAQARARGARVRCGVVARGEPSSDGAPVEVRIDEQRESYDMVFWATGGPPPGASARPGAGWQMVLRQAFAAGSKALDRVMVAEDGDLLLVPDAGERDRVILLRRGSESRDAGLCWPQPPEEWGVWLGPVIHQRLAEAWAVPSEPSAPAAGPEVALTGLDGWPICAVLGAAGRLVESVLRVSLII